jgi:hypothetical protein
MQDVRASSGRAQAERTPPDGSSALSAAPRCLEGGIVAALASIVVVNDEENATFPCSSQKLLANARLLALHNLDAPHLLS